MCDAAPKIDKSIQTEIIKPIKKEDWHQVIEGIRDNFRRIYVAIPDEKRISRGRVYVIRCLTKDISILLEQEGLSQYETGSEIFRISTDFIEGGVALGLLTIHGEINDPGVVFRFFKQAADSQNWDMREIAQMFFRKIIRRHRETAREFLYSMADSSNPHFRRFAAESLRPVGENRWIQESPEYSLEILKLLFREKSPYPRTATGNNLSDLSKKNPDLVLRIVKELTASGDKNSRWIARRACRNLVKKYPHEVFSALGVKEYRYKNRVYRLDEYN